MDIQCGAFEFLQKNLKNKDKTSLIYFGTKIKAEELFSTSLKFASYLKEECKVQKGDVVGLMLPNIPDTIFSFYGINAIGAISNLIDPRIGYGMLNKILKATNTKVLIIFDRIYKNLAEHLDKDIKVILCSPYSYVFGVKVVSKIQAKLSKEIYFKDTLYLPEYKQDIKLDGNELAVYIHSAGTTSASKTVMLSSRALNATAMGVRTTVLAGDDLENSNYAMLMVLPISHGFGAGVCVHTLLSCSMTSVMMPKLVPSRANRLIKKYKVTHLAGIPAMYRKLYEQKNFSGDMSCLERAFCGGDRLDYKFKKVFENRLQELGSKMVLEEGYGLTEVVTVCSVNVDNSPQRDGLSTQGKAIFGAEFKVLNDSQEVGEFETGEIYVKTPAIMDGYLNDAEETKATIVQIDGENWIRTGDIGKLDKDGNIYFIDRIKRSVKIAGINVFPSQIEQVVCNLNFVKNCCAVRRTNEEAKAYIELLVILNQEEKDFEKKIKDHVRTEIIDYAVPRKITIVNEIKLTNIGKADYKYYENK